MTAKVVKLGRHPDLPEAWKKGEMPKTIGECVALLVQRYKARKKIEEKVKLLEAEEKKVKDYMLNTFAKEDLRSVKTKKATVTLVEKDVPHVKDKEAFGRYVYENKAWDLLYGKAVEEAIKARWDEGEQVAGVEKYHDVKIKLTEVK